MFLRLIFLHIQDFVIFDRQVDTNLWFSRSYKQKSDQLYDFYVKNRSARLILSNGVDITEPIYRVIDQKVLEFLPSTLLKLNCIINYIDKFPLKLVILISNLGSVASLVHCVAKSRAIPSYMIINGMLGHAFLDEAKSSTFINSYSVSIRDNYFTGIKNVFCLGDPRMDEYSNSLKRRD